MVLSERSLQKLTVVVYSCSSISGRLLAAYLCNSPPPWLAYFASLSSFVVSILARIVKFGLGIYAVCACINVLFAMCVQRWTDRIKWEGTCIVIVVRSAIGELSAVQCLQLYIDFAISGIAGYKKMEGAGTGSCIFPPDMQISGTKIIL